MKKASKVAKVLFLDFAPDYLPHLHDEGIKLEFIEENPRNRSAVYKFSGKVFRWIEEITKEQTFDLVIVGNNQGIGVHKASCIPETLKSKTIIVWHEKQRIDDMKI